LLSQIHAVAVHLFLCSLSIVLLDECRVAYSCRCRRHTVYDLCRLQPGEITLEY